MYNRILVPTDGSDGAKAAAELAAELLEGQVGGSVTLLNVTSIAKGVSDYTIINPKLVDEFLVRSKLKHKGESIINQTIDIFRQKNLLVDTMVELGDDPGDRIVEIAKRDHFDLIIIGNRGMSLVKELIIGSVSSKVLHKAGCKVIVFKGSENH